MYFIVLVLVFLLGIIKTSKICNDRGIYKNKKCECSQGWETIGADKDLPENQCNYELKSYNVARFISFFCGAIGADMFYLGYTYKGLFKCFLPIGFFVLILVLYNKKMIDDVYLRNYIFILPIIATFLFWSLDFMLIFSGIMKDSNGFSLY